jgi:hypothetical protein
MFGKGELYSDVMKINGKKKRNAQEEQNEDKCFKEKGWK